MGDKTYIDENGINANGQKVTNVADGTIAEGSKDAVNGGQLHATNQRVSTVENRMDGVENRVDRVENRVDNLDNRIDKVGASAAAMANLHPMDFDEDSKVSVAAAVGNYRSETAGALGVFYRPTDRVMMNVSTSFGNGENMIGGGVSFKLGKSSKRLEKAEATNAALVKQVTNLQNRLDALLGVLNPNLSKAFPDVPANHWAYEAVSRLAGNDIIQGYEDGKYHGERTMTRYEMAEIIYNALSKGAKAEANWWKNSGLNSRQWLLKEKRNHLPTMLPTPPLSIPYSKTTPSQRCEGVVFTAFSIYSIVPPPRTTSPSYSTAAWPGVMARWGSSNWMVNVSFPVGVTVAGWAS